MASKKRRLKKGRAAMKPKKRPIPLRDAFGRFVSKKKAPSKAPAKKVRPKAVKVPRKISRKVPRKVSRKRPVKKARRRVGPSSVRKRNEEIRKRNLEVRKRNEERRKRKSEKEEFDKDFEKHLQRPKEERERDIVWFVSLRDAEKNKKDPYQVVLELAEMYDVEPREVYSFWLYHGVS